MSRVASAPLETLEEDCDMVDNPLNQQFEEEQVTTVALYPGSPTVSGGDN